MPEGISVGKGIPRPQSMYPQWMSVAGKHYGRIYASMLIFIEVVV